MAAEFNHMSIVLPVRRRLAVLLLTLGAMSVAARPGYATATADLNNDGVVDRIVVLTEQRHPEIVVSISGHSSPQILKLAGRPVSLVVADVNHDGHLDLSALFPNRRVLVWLNYGRQGFSRLHSQTRSRLHRRGTPRGSPLERALLFTAPSSHPGSPPAGQATPTSAVLLRDSRLGEVLPAISAFDLPSSEQVPLNNRAGRCPSRAPPALPVS